MRMIILTALVVVALLSGCRREGADVNGTNPATGAGAQSAMRKVGIVVGGVPLEVEVADTDAARALGYMYREPPTEGGILFVFDRERYRGFWMKNVSFDLDIAFIDATGRIDQIERMRAWRQESVPSRRPAKYALEVRAGWFAEQGIEPGAKVEIPADVVARD